MARWPASLVAAFSSAPELRPRRPYWPAAQTSAFDPADWASVRDQFPLTRDLAHFSAFVLAAPPRQVGGALDLHRRGLDEDTLGYLVQNEGDLERAVLYSAASYLGAENADIALTDSTTMGLGLVYGGLRLRANQHVLTTEHDFFSTHESLRLAAARSGATVWRVSLYDEPATASADEIVARLMAGVTPATRVVAVTWVHSGTGVKLPITAISAALADLNAGRAEDDRALLCVDGVHAFGVEDATVDELGCDVLVSGTHKWLFGPRGTGIVWANQAAWTAIDAVIPPFDVVSFEAWLDSTAAPTTLGGLTRTPGGSHTFEYRWALSEAFQFHLGIGKAEVAERTHTQATQLKEGLAGIDGVRVVTPQAAEISPASYVSPSTPSTR